MASSKLAVEVIQRNLNSVLSDIRKAAEEVGRGSSPPRLVAVGKTYPAAFTEACYATGASNLILLFFVLELR